MLTSLCITYTLIQSGKDCGYYVGFTADLKNRLREHNDKEVAYTSKKVPWVLVWNCAFKDKNKAVVFERYLKQGSGFAFVRKHLI